MEIVRVKIVCVIFCILVWVEKKEVVNFKQQQLVAAETAGSRSGMILLLKYYSCVTWHESYIEVAVINWIQISLLFA